MKCRSRYVFTVMPLCYRRHSAILHIGLPMFHNFLYKFVTAVIQNNCISDEKCYRYGTK